MCLSKLMYKLLPRACSGALVNWSEMTSNVVGLLHDRHSLGQDDSSVISLQDLILNRITPFKIEKSQLMNLNVCKEHRVRLVVKMMKV